MSSDRIASSHRQVPLRQYILPDPFKILAGSSFPKLRNGNYVDWEWRFRRLLKLEGLLDFLSEDNPKFSEDNKNWETRNTRFLKLIRASVCPDQHVHVMHSEDAFEVLQELWNLHIGPSHFDVLLNEILTLTPLPGETGYATGMRMQDLVTQCVHAVRKEPTFLQVMMHIGSQRYLQIIPKTCVSLLNEDHGISVGDTPDKLADRVRIIEDNHAMYIRGRPKDVKQPADAFAATSKKKSKKSSGRRRGRGRPGGEQSSPLS